MSFRFLLPLAVFLFSLSAQAQGIPAICTPAQLAAKIREYLHHSPGLNGDPYSPEEVAKRQEIFGKEYGGKTAQLSVREYKGSNQKNYYEEWFKKLDHTSQLRIQARIERVKAGDLGDLRPLKGGVWELKIDVAGGFRIYFAKEGKSGVVLLTAGNKATQQKDISLAEELRADFVRH